MLIGIDGNEANIEKRVGIGEYSFELLRQFEEYQISRLDSRLDLVDPRRSAKRANIKYQIYLKNKPLPHMPKEQIGWKYRIVGPKKMWTQIGLPLDLYLHRPKPDVFFSPTHYAPRFCPVPTAISIMDLSYIHFPEMFKKSDLYQLKNWTAYSARKASKVFTISKATKDDIIKAYSVTEDKVVVTYPGIKIQKLKSRLDSRLDLVDPRRSAKRAKIKNMDEIKEKYGIRGEYILFVGTLQPRKNIVRLIEAFSFLCPQNDIQLIIVGKRGWLYESILEAPKKFEVEDKVKFLDFVSDEDLPSLYRNALCFVLPSLYEGFGLPILEAMQNGCPVITSNTSSLPEAAGGAALYVDPKDTKDISSKIQSLIKNERLRKYLIEKGYNQVKKFSWEKTARQTLEALREIGKKNIKYEG